MTREEREALAATIVSLFQKGLEARQISDRVGKSPDYVRKIIHKEARRIIQRLEAADRERKDRPKYTRCYQGKASPPLFISSADAGDYDKQREGSRMLAHAIWRYLDKHNPALARELRGKWS